MKNKKVNLKKKGSSNPDKYFRKMLERYTQVPSHDFSNKKKDIKLSKKILKEMKQLKKILKKFHKMGITEITKEQKDSK